MLVSITFWFSIAFFFHLEDIVQEATLGITSFSDAVFFQPLPFRRDVFIALLHVNKEQLVLHETGIT